MDVLIANDFGEWLVTNVLLRNRYPANKLVTRYDRWGGINGMGVAVGDYDHDSDLDYYVTNLGRNRLYRNNGIGNFKEWTTQADVEDTYVHDTSTLFAVGWGAVFADLDLDTWPDLLVANGFIPTSGYLPNAIDNPNRYYHNAGDGTFSEIGGSAGFADGAVGRGLACGDYDDDGDVDAVCINVLNTWTGTNDSILLYRNELANGNNWLKVRCQGVLSNRDGFGARVEIEVGGETWIAEIGGGSSYGCQNASEAHFGLAAAAMVDRIGVTWPGGRYQELLNIPANQTLLVLEDTASSRSPAPVAEAGIGIRPNPVVQSTSIEIELPRRSSVRVVIYDAAGTLVAKLHDGPLEAGRHGVAWNAVDDSGKRCTAGIYPVEVTIDGRHFAERILLIR